MRSASPYGFKMNVVHTLVPPTWPILTEVSLDVHPTAPSMRVLSVEMMDKQNHKSIYRVELHGGETAAQIYSFFKPMPPMAIKDTLQGLIWDLLTTLSPQGTEFKFPEVDTLDEAKIREFEVARKIRAFKSALAAYGVDKKLSYEQALMVLQEHYVVEPIMES